MERSLTTICASDGSSKLFGRRLRTPMSAATPSASSGTSERGVSRRCTAGVAGSSCVTSTSVSSNNVVLAASKASFAAMRDNDRRRRRSSSRRRRRAALRLPRRASRSAELAPRVGGPASRGRSDGDTRPCCSALTQIATSARGHPHGSALPSDLRSDSPSPLVADPPSNTNKGKMVNCTLPAALAPPQSPAQPRLEFSR